VGHVKSRVNQRGPHATPSTLLTHAATGAAIDTVLKRVAIGNRGWAFDRQHWSAGMHVGAGTAATV
jgi:hypothetical protein